MTEKMIQTAYKVENLRKRRKTNVFNASLICDKRGNLKKENINKKEKDFKIKLVGELNDDNENIITIFEVLRVKVNKEPKKSL